MKNRAVLFFCMFVPVVCGAQSMTDDPRRGPPLGGGNPCPAFSVSVNSATICSGKSAVLTASSTTSINEYVWTPATGLSSAKGQTVTASPTETTIYQVSGTHWVIVGSDTTECTKTASATITVNPSPPTPTITASNLDTNIATLTSSSTSGNQWYKNNVAMAGYTAQTLQVWLEASYSVTATVNGCVSEMSAAFALIYTGVNTDAEVPGVYPTSATQNITISSRPFKKDKPLAIRIVDAVGRLSYRNSLEPGQFAVDVSSLGSGSYLLVAQQDQLRATYRFEKK